MRKWNLGSPDPISLTLAADARFTSLDYKNDHIWELEFGGSEPAAIAIRTTYGLRARAMRIFPRFSEGGDPISDPAAFVTPPRVTAFYANFLEISFSPLKDLDIIAEYWIPDSHTLSCCLTLLNRSSEEREIGIELVAVLSPLEGKIFQPEQMQAVNVLAGKTGDLVPVIFLTGGPAHGSSPHPSLNLKLALGSRGKRSVTWAQAALAEKEDSFELARKTLTRQWDAERARIELTNASQSIDIETGDPAWDAAFALSQQAAFRLFFNASDDLPHPSFVSARLPDHGHSLTEDGSDYTSSWRGQTPLESYYLASLLPGIPELGQGLVKNFLAVQDEKGVIDHKPGLAGQRSKILAAPLLASLTWKLYQESQDQKFLAESYPALQKFFWAWFNSEHDRNHDNLPEWDHPLQTGFEDHPLFSRWHPWSRGVDISTVHSPSLFAALYREAQSLAKISEIVGKKNDIAVLKVQSDLLLKGLQACWEPRSSSFKHLDRDSNLAQRGKILIRQTGGGEIKLKESFEKPIRLLIEIRAKDHAPRRPGAEISEFVTKAGDDEFLAPLDFKPTHAGSVATSKKVYTKIGKITIDDVGEEDKIIIRTVNLSADDQTQLLPLWAGMLDEQQARTLVSRTLSNADRFDRPFGLPACPSPPTKAAEALCLSVHLPWNQFVIEGMLAYGYQSEATRLFAHLMNGIIQNLQENNAFYERYNAEVGTGVGERNALVGLAPVGLFLQILGVRILSSTRVRLEGVNPFPWVVKLRYRGLEVERGMSTTKITFPNGKQAEVTDDAPCIVSI
ncbi:MAG: hypothetical protein DRI32_02940 [Chloroflexi bacterium]|nr:MAG: hypothetical protein DRI32_02940 [Chloroflexota bacterium]